MREVLIAFAERLLDLIYYKDVLMIAAVLAAALPAYIIVRKILCSVVRRII